eukprot:33735_1
MSVRESRRHRGSYRGYKYHSFVLLFDSTAINERINSNLYISSEDIKDKSTLLFSPDITYCNQYGAMYANKGLWRCKLENIDINSNDFYFDPCNGFNDLVLGSNTSIGVIHNTQKLFVIDGFSVDSILDSLFLNSRFDNEIVEESRQCWILDLNSTELVDINPFEYKKYGKHNLCKIGICKNNKYDNNLVYIVTNNGDTAKYDISKNKWNMILQDINKQNEHKPNVFMDS